MTWLLLFSKISAYSYVMSQIETKPQIPAHYHRRNERGLIEVIDLHTGRVLAVQASEKTLLEMKWERLTRIDTPEGPVWIEKNINFDIVGRLTEYPYSQLLADLICEGVANGKTLPAACAEVSLPYSIVLKWKRDKAEFRTALDIARRDRANWMHDEVIQTARSPETSSKDKIAALQWSAEKDDPEKYGSKKQEGAGTQPITVIISTGIDRKAPEEKEAQRPTEILVRAPQEGGEDQALNFFSETAEKLQQQRIEKSFSDFHKMCDAIAESGKD